MVYKSPFYLTLYALAGWALVLALATDVVYLISNDFIWIDMSDWLVSIGAVVGFLALVVGIVQIVAVRQWRRPAWTFGVFSLLAWVAAVWNMLVHSRDGMASIMPEGIILSVVTVLLLLAGWWANRTVVMNTHSTEIVA